MRAGRSLECIEHRIGRQRRRRDALVRRCRQYSAVVGPCRRRRCCCCCGASGRRRRCCWCRRRRRRDRREHRVRRRRRWQRWRGDETKRKRQTMYKRRRRVAALCCRVERSEMALLLRARHCEELVERAHASVHFDRLVSWRLHAGQRRQAVTVRHRPM